MDLKSFSRRQIILLVTLLLIVIAIPITIYLSQKTQIFKPRAQEIQGQIHKVINFDPKVEQVLSPGDTLEGKGIPEAKVTVSITPNGDSKEVTVDKDGKWTYSVPNNIQPKNYNLTITIEDIIGNIASIKTYKIRIVSNSQSFIPDFLIKTVYAQGSTTSADQCNPLFQIQCPTGECVFRFGGTCPQTPTPSPPPPQESDLEALGPEYSDWLSWMHFLSIYPAWDRTNQEIVYVNRETYEREVCGNPDPTRPRCTTSGQVDQFISRIESRNWEFLQHFASYLRQRCYVPAPVMESYFPDLTNIVLDSGQTVNFFNQDDFPALYFLHSAGPHCNDIVSPTDERYIKRSVQAEQELGRLITQAGASFAFSQEDPLGDFFHATENATLGFFPTNTILKLVALKSANEVGYQYNKEVVADAAFAIAGFIPSAKIGGAIQQISRIRDRIINSRTIFRRTFFLERRFSNNVRRAIQQGERVSKQTVENEIARQLEDIPAVLSISSPTAGELAGLRPTNISAWVVYQKFLEPILSTANDFRVFVLPRVYVNNARNQVLDYADRFIHRTVRSVPYNPQFREALDSGRVLVVNDEIFDSIESLVNIGEIAGIRIGDMILFRLSYLNTTILHGGLHHELIHLLNANLDNRFYGAEHILGVGISGLGQITDLLRNSELYRTLHLVYEIMTDYGADVSRGIIPFSRESYSTIGYSLANLDVAEVYIAV